MTRKLPWFPIVFTVALALYTATLAPGLLWGGGDFATFQTRAYLGDFLSDMSIFGHSLWVLLAHPFTWLPIRDVAWRANFAAAVFASLALALLYLSCRTITRSLPAALLGVAALAVSHTFWTYAVMPKVYSLNTLLLAVCIHLLLRWREQQKCLYLLAFGFVYGLSLLNHLVMAVVAFGFALFILDTLRRQRTVSAAAIDLTGVAAAYLLGLAPYLVFSVRQGTATGTGGVILGFLGGLGYAATHLRQLGQAAQWGVLLGAYQFPLTGLIGLLGVYGLWRCDRGLFWMVVGAIVGTVAFLVAAVDPGPGSVYIWNLHYYLQGYVFYTLALATGYRWLWDRLRPSWRGAIVLVTVLLPIVLYAAAPGLVRSVWQDMPDFRPLPGRDNFAYVLSPWKHGETGPRRFGEAVFAALPPDSVLYADYGIYALLRYMQIVEKSRTDVTLINLTAQPDQLAAIQEYSGAPLFLADTYRYYDLARIREVYDLTPVGPIYQLQPPAGEARP